MLSREERKRRQAFGRALRDILLEHHRIDVGQFAEECHARGIPVVGSRTNLSTMINYEGADGATSFRVPTYDNLIKLIEALKYLTRDAISRAQASTLLPTSGNTASAILDHCFPVDVGQLATPVPLIHVDSLTANPEFVGRDDEMKQLSDWYSSAVPVAAITGIRGVGKTWLARNWCARTGVRVSYCVADQDALLLNSIEKCSAHLLDRLADVIRQDPTDDQRLSDEDIAVGLRTSGVLLILDQVEVVLDKRGPHPGKPARDIRRFLSAYFRTKGPGRMILISNLRIKDVVEPDVIEKGDVTVIHGGGRDTMQLGGLASGEGVELLRNRRVAFGAVGVVDDQLSKVVERLEGHPQALVWFSQLQASDVEAFLSRRSQPILQEARGLLARVVSYCDADELEMLKILVARGPRPTLEDDLKEIARTSRPDVHVPLDALRRRCLAEHALAGGAGFTCHALVREYITQQYVSEMSVLHLRAAGYFAERASAWEDANEEALSASFHYYMAGEDRQGARWRNEYTARQLALGKQAYFGGDYQRAVDANSAFLEAWTEDDYRQRAETADTAILKSTVHCHRAVSQHQVRFDWSSETADLRSALELDRRNTRAMTFYIAILVAGLRERIPWVDIEAEASFVLEQAKPLTSSAQRHERLVATSVTMNLLCLRGDNAPSRQERADVEADLNAVISESESHQGDRDGLLVGRELATALLRAALYTAQHNDKRTEAERLSRRAYEVAVEACAMHRDSAEIILMKAASCRLVAEVAERNADRLAYLEQALETLRSLDEGFPLPRGFVREFAACVDSLSRQVPADDARDRVVGALAELGRFVSSRAHRLSESEIVEARLRLLIRASIVDADEGQRHLSAAEALARPLLVEPRRLTPRIAQHVVQMFAAICRDPHNDLADDDDAPMSRDVVKKDLLGLIRKALVEARRFRPSDRFTALELAVLTEYLRTEWNSGEAREAENGRIIARGITSDPAHDRWGLVAVADFWEVVAKKTHEEANFNEAIAAGALSFDLMRSIGVNDEPSQIDLWEASFHRNLQSYATVLTILRRYLEFATAPGARRRACHIYLDVAAHSISPFSDLTEAELVVDAQNALMLYDEYLQFLGGDEDVKSLPAAKRVLWRAKIERFLKPDEAVRPTWAEEVCDEVGFEEEALKDLSEGVLYSLYRNADPVACALGSHLFSGTIWREVGTFLERALDVNRAIAFWRIADWWFSRDLMTDPRHDGRRRDKPSAQVAWLSHLNVSRALLREPVATTLWEEGRALLEQIASVPGIPWRDHRHALQLLKSSESHAAVQAASPASGPTPEVPS